MSGSFFRLELFQHDIELVLTRRLRARSSNAYCELGRRRDCLLERVVGQFLELLQGIELSLHRHKCHEHQVDAIALFSSQQWTIRPEPGLVRLPGIRKDVL